MSCDVASLPFQVHANYGTRSIDFGIFVSIDKFIKRRSWNANCQNYIPSVVLLSSPLLITCNKLMSTNILCNFKMNAYKRNSSLEQEYV